jgi:hypothetical protein
MLRHYNRSGRYDDKRDLVDAIALNDPGRYPTFARNAAPLDLGESPETRTNRQIGVSALTVALAILLVADLLLNDNLGAELLLFPAFVAALAWLVRELAAKE